MPWNLSAATFSQVWRAASVALMGLVLGCAVPTKIGELPDTDTQASDGSTTNGVTSSTTVVEPTTSSTTEDGTGSSGESETESVGPGPQMSFAILFGDIPDEPGTTTGGNSTTGTGGDVPDDTLLVEITTGPASCVDVNATLPCGGAWTVSFSLPAELQVPGTYELFPDLNGFQFFNFDADETGECGGGGGTLEGTVIIESIDDTQVVGRIENAQSFDFDANVSFVAPRC